MNGGETQRLLVIGLDGGTYDVFRPLIRQGYMPNLANLLERSCWGDLESTIPPFTPTAWSTFITGQNPGQHGVIGFQTPDMYNYTMAGSDFISAESLSSTLWQILSDAGKRISVINVPMTYPPHPVNGHIISGMLTPSKQTAFVYPPELKHRLREDYVIDVSFIRDGSVFRQRDFPPEHEMIKSIRQMTSVRIQTILDVWSIDAAWDFAMVVFTGTDRLFHFFWHYIEELIKDAHGKQQKSKLKPSILSEVRSYLGELDDAIGQLIQAAGENASILLMSDHGFGPAPRWRLYVNTWLEQLGYLQRRKAQGMWDMEYLRVRIGRTPRLKAMLRRLLPQRIQDSATTTARSTSPEIINWQNTRAFYAPIYFQICGISINQKGMQSEGIVEPGEAYGAIREQIIEHAHELRNPITGKPVVEAAYRREEIYTGRHVEAFPDIILVLDPDYLGASSLAGTSAIEQHTHPMRSGEHRKNGMFALASPNIDRHGYVKGLQLIDVPPTILYEIGLEIPDSFDGRAMTTLYDRAFLDRRPVRFRPNAVVPDQHIQPLTPSEKALIEQRLRGLGYL